MAREGSWNEGSESGKDMTPLGVRFVVNGLGVSGKVKTLVELAARLDRRRFDPAIWCMDERGIMAADAEAAGVTVEVLERKPRLDPALTIRMGRRLRAERVAIVHAVNPPAMLYAGLAGRQARVPVLVGALSAFACLTPDTIRDMGGERQPLTSATPSNRLRNRIASHLMHRIVVVSESLGRGFAGYNGIRREKFVTLGYAVDVHGLSRGARLADRNRIRAELTAGPADPVIGTVAQLIPRKDLGTLLEAFARLVARHPNALLVTAGDGPLRDELGAQAQRLGIAARTRFLGHRQDVASVLAAMDIFVLSSAFEPYGLAVLEAMAAGLPIVATNVGEMSEILGQGALGVLVPSRDAKAMAQALGRLLDDGDLAHRLATAVGTHVREHHSIEGMVNRYESLYMTLLEERAGRHGGMEWRAVSSPGTRRPAAPEIGVLHVVGTLEFGGLENVAIDLAAHTPPPYRPSICVLGAGGGLLKRAEGLGLKCHVMDKRPGRDYLLPLRIARLVRQERVRVVHTHNVGAHLYGLLGGRLAGGQSIITTRHGSEYGGRKAGAPWMWRRTDRVVAVSEDTRQRLLEWCAVAPEQVVVIPNGIDLRPYHEQHDRQGVRREMGWGDGDLILGTVARLSPEKAQDLLIRAFARAMPDGRRGRLVLVGDGPSRKELEALVSALGVKGRVDFLGFRRDVPALLSGMDLFVLPSRMEGMALTLIEAMASGLPVVATDVGGSHEVVADGKTGVLVPAEDPEALAGALRTLLLDPGMRRAFGDAGRIVAEQRFSVERMARDYAALYDEVLSRRHRESALKVG